MKALTGNLMSYAFDQINYNYTGYASIPNETTMVVHLEEITIFMVKVKNSHST